MLLPTKFLKIQSFNIKGVIIRMLQRKIEYQIDTISWTSLGRTVPTELKLASSMNINILEILIHIAKRTSLPISFGFTLGDLWAWLRYLPAISVDLDFKLRREWEEIDSHQKTILSDDMGMGFSSTILSQALNLLFICPTNYIVKRHPSIALGKNGKRGPDKSPDFIAVDINGDLHVIECKGTQSSRKVLDDQLKSGQTQKNNLVDPSRIINERIVSGVFIPQHNSKETALFKVADPEYPLDFSSVTKQEIIETIILGEIASSFRLLGLPKLANSIARNQRLTSQELKSYKKDITKLENEIVDGEIYKKTTSFYKIDDGFTNTDLDSIHTHIGMKNKFINELFYALERNDSDKSIEPIEFAKELRNQIKNQSLPLVITETEKEWVSIESPIGLLTKFELAT